MFKHEKMLFHPVAVEKPNPQYAAQRLLKCIFLCQTQVLTHLRLTIQNLFLLISSKTSLPCGREYIVDFSYVYDIILSNRRRWYAAEMPRAL